MSHATHTPAKARPAWGRAAAVFAAAGLAGLAKAYLTPEEFEMAIKAADVLTNYQAHDDRQKAKIAAAEAERDAAKAELEAERADLGKLNDLVTADAPAPTPEPPATDGTTPPATDGTPAVA